MSPTTARTSLGLSIEETIRRNTEELRAAARILGIAEIIELGFETDTLADVPLGRLRERIVYLLRKHRPYAVFTFDPDGRYENNQDHLRLAQAVDEAFWVACFDKHHPEHFAEGLEPFSVCERWYFARSLPEVTHVEEIGATFERKVLALCAHREMMRNTIQQSRLQLRTWGKRVDWLDASMDGDLRPLLGTFLQEQAKAVAVQAGLDGETCLAEAFRLVRFGDLEPLFQMMAVPLDEAVEPAPLRGGLDPAVQSSGEAPEPTRPVDSILPSNLDTRARLMGHHHLCAGAIEPLMSQPAFRLMYADLVNALVPAAGSGGREYLRLRRLLLPVRLLVGLRRPLRDRMAEQDQQGCRRARASGPADRGGHPAGGPAAPAGREGFGARPRGVLRPGQVEV